jgi:hypothetical protein
MVLMNSGEEEIIYPYLFAGSCRIDLSLENSEN